MPAAPLHPCSKPGCSALVRGQPRCEKHTVQQRKEADCKRLSSTERGYDSGWIKVRNAKRAADPLCERCLANGIVRVLDVVHHKDRNRANRNWENLESLCLDHHDAEHKGERFGNNKRWQRGEGDF